MIRTELYLIRWDGSLTRTATVREWETLEAAKVYAEADPHPDITIEYAGVRVHVIPPLGKQLIYRRYVTRR